MNGQDTSAAHSALQYIISKALLEGKIGKTTLQIPITDLFSQYEGPAFTAEASGLVLKLEITSSWDRGEVTGDFELEGDIELDDDIIFDNNDEDDEESNNGFN